MKKTLDMTTGSPAKLLIRFAFPIWVGYLFQQIYTLADRVIVGQYIGADAFSAVGSTNAISSMFMSMCMGTSIGAGVVVSQFYGAGDEKNTAKAISNGVYINIGIALIMTVIALFTIHPILSMLNTPASLMNDAISYITIYMGGLVAVSAYYVPFSILQALGDSKTPLIFLVLCSILNIVLDLIFVIPLGMRVKGAAIATVLAQIVAAICCIVYTFRKIPIIRASIKYKKADKRLILKTIKISVPTGLQYSLMYLSSIVLQRIVNGFGSNVIGSFTATTQMEILVEQLYLALGAAIVTYTGQNIGAGNTKRIKQGLKSALFISTIVSILLALVFWVGGKQIMSIFVSDREIISTSATGIRITATFFTALGVVQILRYLLNGAGDSGFTLINGIIEIISRITLAFLLTSIPIIGMWGIWLTTGFTWVITALSALWRYKSDKWLTKSLIRKNSNNQEVHHGK